MLHSILRYVERPYVVVMTNGGQIESSVGCKILNACLVFSKVIFSFFKKSKSCIVVTIITRSVDMIEFNVHVFYFLLIGKRDNGRKVGNFRSL